MISIKKLSEISRERVATRLQEQQDSKNKNWQGMFLAENSTFNDRLINACHKDSFDINELVLLALPEKLISKISYLAIGSLRNSQDISKRIKFSETLTDDEIKYLKDASLSDDDFVFSNLKGTKTKPINIESILLCHGLSPIGDSIALIAEIGRLSRVSTVLNLPIRVMLADISWMSSNRSIRQFSSLTEKDIDSGLRICLDKRQRLYKGLNLEADLKEITYFPRHNAISGRKLESISSNYIRLAKALWGEKASGRLEPKIVSSIDKPLEGFERIENLEDTSLPEHIKTFAKFPKILQSLDQHLKDHLEILRTVAKQFNSFDEEIFTYFFAQYYAQAEYKNTYLKIAPISELKFDKPFDDLHKCFKAWDDNLSKEIENINSSEITSERLPAIYLPQYKVGNHFVLPYSPLSLDILKKDLKDHNLLKDELILINENQDIEIIKKITRQTQTFNRNRLFSDLLSFVVLCNTRAGFDIANIISNNLFNQSFETILESINSKLKKDFITEEDARKNNSVVNMWQSWFNNIENTDEIYTPPHIFVLLFTDEVWSNEKNIEAFSKIIQIAIGIYKELTK